MAHAMGADYIELDVVLTRDQALIVLHDLYLDAVTDVAQKFPTRHREDQHYYAIDFSLDEIRTLRLNERREASGKATFPARFPISGNIFRVPTLEEEITLIQGMNRSTGRDVGLYIEPKSPQWHQQQGEDILARLIDALNQHGYYSKTDRVLVQSFDAHILKRARREMNTRLKLVQLIGQNEWGESTTDFGFLRTAAGLQEVSTYADGIGPWLPQVVDWETEPGQLRATSLTEQAHRMDLFVHAYTLRADQLPNYMSDFEQVLEFLVRQSGLDGVFTDFPDKVVQYLAR